MSIIQTLEDTARLDNVDAEHMERQVETFWKNSPELRSEFLDLQTAIAYFQAVNAGSVKILRGAERT